MMKNYLLFVMLIASCQLFSQEIYLNTGKNFTKYNYKNGFGQADPDLQSGTGNFYEIGFNKPLPNKHMLYSYGLSLNEYNALGGNVANSYSWETKYLGLKAGLGFSFFPMDDLHKLNFLVQAGILGETIIYGKQKMDGAFYDLVHQKEFSGVVVEPSMGLQVKYRVPSFGSLSVGYNLGQTYNVSNSTTEKISFMTHQLQLGVHFPIN